MTSSRLDPPEPVYVLCCDDHFDDAVFDQQFAEDWERRRRRGERRGLVRYGTTRPSVVAACAALDTAARNGELPDVVLIDNWLKTPAGAAGEGGFALLRHVVASYPTEQRPRCVLITGGFTPPMAHAFVAQGGTQAIDKLHDSWATWLETIWKAVDGVRWHHTPDPPLVKLTPRDLEILPYLEADRDVPEIARALGLDAAGVHDARRKLHARLRDAGLIDGKPGGRTVAIAQAALRGGAIWTPLAYRDPAQAPASA